MNDIEQIISRLERQREAIDRAITAVREIEGPIKRSAVAATRTAHRQTAANRPASPAAEKASPAQAPGPKSGQLTPART